jgi:hypothetical protein
MLMKYPDKDWFSRTSVALTDGYRTKAQANTLSVGHIF